MKKGFLILILLASSAKADPCIFTCTFTPTITPTFTPTATPTWTPQDTPTFTSTPTPTWTPTVSPTPTVTPVSFRQALGVFDGQTISVMTLDKASYSGTCTIGVDYIAIGNIIIPISDILKITIPSQ